MPDFLLLTDQLLISMRKKRRDVVQVYEWPENKLTAEWFAKFTDDFDGGAVWHPSESDVVFFTADGRGRSKKERRLGVGENAANLIKVNVNDSQQCLRSFSEGFTETCFGISSSLVGNKHPYVFLSNCCGNGSIGVIGNV